MLRVPLAWSNVGRGYSHGLRAQSVSVHTPSTLSVCAHVSPTYLCTIGGVAEVHHSSPTQPEVSGKTLLELTLDDIPSIPSLPD